MNVVRILIFASSLCTCRFLVRVKSILFYHMVYVLATCYCIFGCTDFFIDTSVGNFGISTIQPLQQLIRWMMLFGMKTILNTLQPAPCTRLCKYSNVLEDLPIENVDLLFFPILEHMVCYLNCTFYMLGRDVDVEL